ncbi:hypothetical protein AMELA_G00014090, partial [Ameiurus melas]
MMEVGPETCQNFNSRQQQQRRAATHTLEEQKKIYTDWANHYLAKSGHKRLIRDLQQDIADGVLLAEIIQVVANEKIADINGYPENRSQMIENIDACLGFLAAKGVNIKGLCAEEIRSGNLKAILGLFFTLSRYKQQQHVSLKQANEETHILQAAACRQPSASPAQAHSPWCTPHAPPCLVHIHEHEQNNTSESVLKIQDDMQSRLPGPSIQPRRSSSRRSQSFIHRDESKTPMLTCTQRTDKSSSAPIMVDQGPPSSPVLPSNSTTTPTSTKGWRSKSLNAKHSATSSILSIKQPSSGSLEVPPKVIAQKSMLDKLKLFNSRPSSRASSVASLEDPEASNPDPNEANICPVHPEAHLGNQQPIMGSDSSPKLALKGIAQRTLGRTLVPKLKAAEKDKDKVKTKAKADKDKTAKRSSGIEQERIMEVQQETRTEPPTLADVKKSSLIPKGSKGHSNAKKEGSSQSGIPKPGQTSKASGMVKNSVTTSGGKVEHSRGFRAGGPASGHKCLMENKNSNSVSSLVSTEGRCSSSSISQTSNTNNIQLPQTQHSHPNTATVAPFMYRSQTDVDKTSMTEGGKGKKERSVLHSKSIHTSLESLRGEDSESRRLRTVKNIADLRQNLEETMSSLRQVTHISHSTLQTTFDACITTEISTRGSLALTPRPVSAAPWRPGTSGPRLQAGDAPSLTSDYSSNKAEMLEGSAGYVSDGDILGKSVRMESATSGYMTDGGLSVYTRRTHKHSSTLPHCESH